jgi:hypothetical protein
VREQKPRKRKAAAQAGPKHKEKDKEPPHSPDDKLAEAMELIRATVEALVEERGEDEPVYGSMVKQTLKRRRPGFNERYYGFSSFNDLLEEAGVRGYVELERDAKSGGYVVRPM